MTISQSIAQLQEIVAVLKDVEQCRDDVEAFTVAIKCMEYFHALRNHLDISYSFASRHYQNDKLNDIDNLLHEIGDIK